MFGAFEAMTTGIGPDLSFVHQYLYNVQNQKKTLTMGAEVKWLPELSVSNRLQGNIVWLKFEIAWGTAPSSANALAAPNVRALTIIPAL